MHQKALLEGLSSRFSVSVCTLNENIWETGTHWLCGPVLREKSLFYCRDNYNSSKINQENSIRCTLGLLTFWHWNHFYIGKLCDACIKVKEHAIFEDIIQGTWVGSLSPRECEIVCSTVGCRMSKWLHGWSMVTGSLIKEKTGSLNSFQIGRDLLESILAISFKGHNNICALSLSHFTSGNLSQERIQNMEEVICMKMTIVELCIIITKTLWTSVCIIGTQLCKFYLCKNMNKYGKSWRVIHIHYNRSIKMVCISMYSLGTSHRQGLWLI